MDEEIAKWTIEFLLRQDINDRILNNLLSTLPLPNNDYRLRKALLLRRIGSQASNGSVNENILDHLEILEELDHREGKPALESMKAAYCAVAVDCTVRFLEEETENNGKYIATVKRIWRERVDKVVKSEGKAGVVSENLVRWREDILAAIWESDVRNRILLINTRSVALKAVKCYLDEAWRDAGPSFLELAAKRMHERGATGKEVAGRERCGQIMVFNGQVASDMAADATSMDGRGLDKYRNFRVDEPAIGNEEIQRVQAPVKPKHVAGHSRAMPGAPRRAKIVGNEELDEDMSLNKDSGLPHQAEVPSMREKGLESHLDETENVASVATEKGAENVNGQPAKEEPNEREVHQQNADVDKDAEEAQRRNEGNSELHGPSQCQINPSRPGLMDRNPTARTYRWEDSATDSLGASPIRYRIPSSKRRRSKKMWSPLEENTLRDGVKRFGKGNWKLILNVFRNVFEGRTEVDLKDKWRNLMRQP